MMSIACRTNNKMSNHSVKRRSSPKFNRMSLKVKASSTGPKGIQRPRKEA